ncbi:para-aminobenzoate synthetase component 2 [Aquisalibacillus elongatus]|uniref:Para-aminobenzoate synthetase component 2 n=1 Tax=Aquisalibacillus elongatus TaxID=485577 RepID=A0A3N5BZY6_9BACI|nr:para-aminobenzoate synthetase component 2 [Aquisalibacillus elongatus]
MILVIDHEDSFTYNLVHDLEEIDEVKVVHYEDIHENTILDLNPRLVLLSPGPGHPIDKKNSIKIVNQIKGTVPIFGVCLGFQIIVQALGGQIVEANRPIHGHIELVTHDSKTIYTNLDQPLQVTRYHSLVADREHFPNELEITARSKSGEIMSCRHQTLPIEGVQYHPEAILTTQGKHILRNFLDYYKWSDKDDETSCTF